MKENYLTKEQVNYYLNQEDLTKDKNHCIYKIVENLKNILYEKYKNESENLISSIELGSKITTIENNYTNLGYRLDEVTLNQRYTKYINEKEILRTQMSATIPPLLEKVNNLNNYLWICPGIVYRRDVRDKTHVANPHQIDIWTISQNYKYSRNDLLDLVEIIIKYIEKEKNQKIKWKYNETNHNYTDNGIEVEILYNGQWLELLECGEVAKSLLKKYNLNNYTGLALGLGLERLAMIIKEIEDIRLLKSENIQIRKQMDNLSKYIQISNQPKIKRDLSIAVNNNKEIEEITQNIIELLDKLNLDNIEDISIKSVTNYNNLPELAQKRLGMDENMKNILLSITVCDLNKTLTSEEANKIYNLIYEKIHEGKIGYKI